jgi:hypothetical protein
MIMSDEATTKWFEIPEVVDTSAAPFDEGEYLLYADSATVDVVRLAYWQEARENPCKDGEFWEGGWWSARHSVTSEHIDFLKFSHWAYFERPTD